MNYNANSRLMNIKFLGNLFLFVSRIHCAYFRNVFIRQFIQSPKTWRTASLCPTFAFAIGHILSMCSKPQMRRIATRRIIAFMANLYSIIEHNFVMVLKRNSMRSFIFPIDPDFPVSKRGCRTNPRPAIIRARFFNKPGKLFRNRQPSDFPRQFLHRPILFFRPYFALSSTALTAPLSQYYSRICNFIHVTILAQAVALSRKDLCEIL